MGTLRLRVPELLVGVLILAWASGCSDEPADEGVVGTPPASVATDSREPLSTEGSDKAPSTSTGGSGGTAIAGPPGVTREDMLDALWEESGLEGDRVDVDLIREVSDAEWLPAYADCLTAAGFPPEVSDSEMVKVVVPEGQEESHALADYTCKAQYPRRLEYLQPLTPEQLSIVYDWLIAETVPCFAEQGYEVADVPTRESFLEQYQGPETMWLPQYGVVGGEVPMSVDELCPRFPPQDVLYGG